MEDSDDLLCLFSARVDNRQGSAVIEIPRQEITVGAAKDGEVYRVALLPSDSADGESEKETSSGRSLRESEPKERRTDPDLPVEEGDQRTVTIEDIGEQGDGIARVKRGYVVIVPDTEVGERVVAEITDVTPNVAFGRVSERKDYYE
ncbi:TRAM domain-containing protein [Halostella sp. PRR32]|uniref:TRAM domain-containing protein n=1 Tax=Halostella sp. PRR32 TaxID=3098147 RepID=UPI002B1D9C70|nr:TRAM domain-containing protein [Halostella sp. PRR32]